MGFDFRNGWLILCRIVAEPFQPKRKLFLFAVFVGLTAFSIARFGLGIDADYAAFLEREKIAAASFVSGHDYDPEGQGPGREALRQELAPLYARFGWKP
jgi:hypothetical protein